MSIAVRLPLLVVVVTIIALGRPVSVVAQAPTVIVELMFGLSSADGTGVSEQAWDAYLDEELSRSVPGFTVMDCRGGWRENGRMMREACKYVLILMDSESIPALSAAVEAYKERFDQKSVLWLQRPCSPGLCDFR